MIVGDGGTMVTVPLIEMKSPTQATVHFQVSHRGQPRIECKIEVRCESSESALRTLDVQAYEELRQILRELPEHLSNPWSRPQ